jgi:hypothetical protein
MKGWIFGIAALVVVAAIATAYSIVYPTFSHRYRLVVAVEKDGRVYSGSSVIEVDWTSASSLPERGPFTYHVRGQAALIQLPDNSAIVAALGTGQTSQDTPDGATSAVWLAAKAFGNTSTTAELSELPKLRGRRHLSNDQMPRLIYFKNIADPQTAKRFKAEGISSLLGPSARLSAYVEITSDPIVVDIDKKLPWFDRLRRPLVEGVIRIEYGFSLAKTMFIGDAS